MKKELSQEQKDKIRFWNIAEKIVQKKDWNSFVFRVMMGYKLIDESIYTHYLDLIEKRFAEGDLTSPSKK